MRLRQSEVQAMNPPKTKQLRARSTLFALAVLLTGCSTFSPDGGFGRVQQITTTHLGKTLVMAKTEADHDTINGRVAQLLAKPLTADDAIQIALLNNRGLQASFQELGVTEAEVVQAGRLPNPGFSFSRLRRGSELELERGVHFNLARWLMMPMVMPWAGAMEARRFEQTQAVVAMRVLSLAADTRKAHIMAVAAAETVRYTRQVMQAAQASAELARRMAAVGNFSKLQQAREQSFYADAALNQARAQQSQNASREKLIRLLGLWGEQTSFTLPERLPDLPKTPIEQPDIERLALAQRLDVQSARLAAEQSAKSLGLTRATRFVNVLELGLRSNSSNELPTQRGWEISLELPLFDWGDARVARAESIYMQALHHTAEMAINARSEVREAYGNYRAAHDIARHQRDEIVPLRQRINDENVLRYNGMLIGVFELLADARVQIASVNGAIDALRDFWLAQADLDMALIGKPSLAAMAAPAMATEAGDAKH